MKTHSSHSLVAAGALIVLGWSTGFAQPTVLISNLDSPGPPGNGVIGDIETVLPGTGYAVGLLNGTTAYQLNSVTLEFIGTSLPAAGFGVQIYSFGPPGSVTPPGWPFAPYAQLGNPTISPQPTPWPGQTVFVTFTPSAPVFLAPSSGYWIGASEAANGNDNNGLLFAYSQTYGVAGNVQMYAGSTGNNQWELDPTSNTWIMGSPSGYTGLIMELTATAVPEPSPFWLLLLGAGAAAYVRMFGFNRARPVPACCQRF